MANSEPTPPIPASKKSLAEAVTLSGEIMRNIELSELPLATIALKASRLARLLNDFDHHRIFQSEAAGYQSSPSGIPPEPWRLMGMAGRIMQGAITPTNVSGLVGYTESIEVLEAELRSTDAALAAAADRDVAITSANPNQFVGVGLGNTLERGRIRMRLTSVAGQLASRRAFVYDYALRKNMEVLFSGTADDIFSRVRERVDARIGILVPDSVQQFNTAYENLRSENPEDWANAVHSCRRILQALADAVFPATTHTRAKTVAGKAITIKLGPDNYINRLIAFAEDRSESLRFREIVGSELRFLGDRLDSLFAATQKGSHSGVNPAEADRYVVYTYLLVGDLLSLRQDDADRALVTLPDPTEEPGEGPV